MTDRGPSMVNPSLHIFEPKTSTLGQDCRPLTKKLSPHKKCFWLGAKMFLTGGSRPLTRGKMFWNRDGRPLTTGVHPAKMLERAVGLSLLFSIHKKCFWLRKKYIFPFSNNVSTKHTYPFFLVHSYFKVTMPSFVFCRTNFILKDFLSFSHCTILTKN